jgi:hypothetical protein
MKRKGLLLLVFAALAAGGAFAQKVGDTVDVFGKNYTVQEAKDGKVLLQLTPTLDGTWKFGSSGHIVTISGSNGVFKQIGSSALVQDALKKGFIKVGDLNYRNLKKTGDLTWKGQTILYGANSNAPDVCVGTKLGDCTITLSADGKTFVDSASGTYTRQ